MKQETLEEVAERLYPNRESFLSRFQSIERKAFIEGAKWQQEKSKSNHLMMDEIGQFQFSKPKAYSEEEVQEIISKLMNDVHCGDICFGDNVIDFKVSPRQWFEQFKNK